MIPSLTDTLCTRCGLCCDGSLFADVELASRTEATRLEIMGLEVEDGDGDHELLSQPCTALAGTRCGIYAYRPKCCRTFECKLLQEVGRGAVPLERAAEQIAGARRQIQGVKELLTQMGQRDVRLPLKERCVEALAGEPRATREGNRKRAELESAMLELERLIQKTFLSARPAATSRVSRP